MSSFSKFLAWLAGRSGPPNAEELRRDLRVLERRLERFEKRLESKRRGSIKAIERSLKNGDLEIAKEYAKQAVLMERDLKTIIKLRGKVTNLLNIVERGLIIDKIRESLQDMIPLIQYVANSVTSQDLQNEFAEMLKNMEKLEVGQEVLEESISDLSGEIDVEESAEKLLREKMVEQGLEVTEVKKERERKVSKKEIEKLLKEVENEDLD